MSPADLAFVACVGAATAVGLALVALIYDAVANRTIYSSRQLAEAVAVLTRAVLDEKAKRPGEPVSAPAAPRLAPYGLLLELTTQAIRDFDLRLDKDRYAPAHRRMAIEQTIEREVWDRGYAITAQQLGDLTKEDFLDHLPRDSWPEHERKKREKPEA
jgi:hypothetical protein